MDNAKLKMPKKLSLSKSLKISYMKTNEEKKRALKKYGYRLDESLTDHNKTVAYNNDQQKLLFATAGSHNLKDWTHTNSQILLGKLAPYGLKNTDRFKESAETLERAKQKYKDRKRTNLVGHSMGGTITNYLPYDDQTKGYALNSGFTLMQPIRNKGGKLKNIRVVTDPISALGSVSSNMNNILPSNSSINPLKNLYQAHTEYGKRAKILL